MESYFRKSLTLKSGDKDISVSKAPSRSQSVDPAPRSESVDIRVETRETREIRKVAYQSDVCELKKSVEDLKSLVSVQNKEIVVIVEEMSKQLFATKQDVQEKAKDERTKAKLDSFVVSYNENEKAHSDVLISLQNVIDELNNRLKVVEEVL